MNIFFMAAILVSVMFFVGIVSRVAFAKLQLKSVVMVGLGALTLLLLTPIILVSINNEQVRFNLVVILMSIGGALLGGALFTYIKLKKNKDKDKDLD